MKKAQKSSNISTLKFHGLVPQKGNRNVHLRGRGTTAILDLSKVQMVIKFTVKVRTMQNLFRKWCKFQKRGNRILDLPSNFSGKIDSVKVDGEKKEFTHDESRNQIMILDVAISFDEDQSVDIKLK